MEGQLFLLRDIELGGPCTGTEYFTAEGLAPFSFSGLASHTHSCFRKGAQRPQYPHDYPA